MFAIPATVRHEHSVGVAFLQGEATHHTCFGDF